MTDKEVLKLALEALELLCVKCRSNEWGPDTPRKEILNWMHDHASKAHTAIEEALAQPEHSATYQKINLSLLKHSDNCRFWDEGDLCTCGASEFHELQFWKNKALAQPESDPWREAVAQPKIDPWREAVAQPEQEPDYREALRVLSLALEEAPTGLTPKQRSVWQQSKSVLLSGGGMA